MQRDSYDQVNDNLASQKWNSIVWHVTINVHTVCPNYTHGKRSQIRIETGGYYEGRTQGKRRGEEEKTALIDVRVYSWQVQKYLEEMQPFGAIPVLIDGDGFKIYGE
jgi:hypothetical protein